MPLALPTSDRDRTVLDAAAHKLQRKPLSRVGPMRDALAALMRAGVAQLDQHIVRAAVHADDAHMLLGAVPHLASGRPIAKRHPRTLRKAAPPPADATAAGGGSGSSTLTYDQLIAQIAQTFLESMKFSASLVPSFTVVDPRAVSFAREQAGRFLSDLDARALANAREAISFGIQHGITVQQTSNFLASSLYLPDRGRTAIQNYFDALIKQLEAGASLTEASRAEASSRALASTWANATSVDELVQRYSDRWVKYVAETQARTMTIEASNAGLVEGWNQLSEAGVIDGTSATLVWYATDDDRTCPECDDLDGTEQPFDDPDFGGVPYPPAHPDCRCTVVLITGTGSEIDVGEGDTPELPAGEADSEAAVETADASIAGDVGMSEDDALAAEMELPPIEGELGGDFTMQGGGFVKTSDLSGGEGTSFYINGLHVPDELRGQGRGTAIMQQLMADADAQRAKLVLHVGETRDDLVGWYERQGFSVVKNDIFGIQMEREPIEAAARSLPEVPAPGAHAQWVEGLRTKYNLPDIRIVDAQDHLVIEHIGAVKGSGDARKVIEDVLKRGDELHMPVTITPSDLTSPSPTILRNLGFKSSRGQYGETLVRDPLVVEPKVPIPEPRPLPIPEPKPALPEPPATPPTPPTTLPPLSPVQQEFYNNLPSGGDELRFIDLMRANRKMSADAVENMQRQLVESGHLKLRIGDDGYSRYWTKVESVPAPSPPLVPTNIKPHDLWQAGLQHDFGLYDIKITDHGTHLSIDNIGAQKGSGDARKVIEAVMRRGDELNLPVTITPSDLTSPSPTVLRNLGFKSTRGRYDEALIRDPGGVAAPPLPKPIAPKPEAPALPGYHMTGDRISYSSKRIENKYSGQFDAIDKIHSFGTSPPEGWQKWRGDSDFPKAKPEYPGQYVSKYDRVPPDNDVFYVFERSKPRDNANAAFWSGQGKAYVNSAKKRPIEEELFSITHEYGHALDNQLAEGLMRGRANRYASELALVPGGGTESKAVADAWREWHNAVANSENIRTALTRYNPQWAKTYYLTDREVWARSYSQYMANRLGGQTLDGLRMYQRFSPGYQWSDLDFTPVGKAVEGVLRAYGLLYE